MAEATEMKITPEMEEEFKEAFNLFDRDHDGLVATTELGTLMRSLGQSPTNAKVDAIIAEMLKDSQSFEFPTFMAIMEKHMEPPISEERIREAFKAFDKDGSGMIPASELKHLLTTVGEKLSEKEVEEMLQEANVDDKGMINYVDFAKKLSAQ